MPVATNILARKRAKDVMDLALAEFHSAKYPDVARRSFELLAEMIGELLNKNSPKENSVAPLAKGTTKPMTDLGANVFGAKKFPFGKYKGTAISDVPLDYLDWYAGQTDEFRVDVGRYLASPNLQREMATIAAPF